MTSYAPPRTRRTAEEQGQTVLLRIGLVVLGPLVLGGIGLVWFVDLVVLHVVRRTEAA